MSYIVLGGHCCDIVLKVHAPSEEKSDDSKDSFMRNGAYRVLDGKLEGK